MPPTRTALSLLVVVPSGSKDDELGIKVVTGVDTDPGACAAPAYSGCIVARRAIHFLSHSTLTLDVPMRASCKNIACDPKSTCVSGVCRPECTALLTKTNGVLVFGDTITASSDSANPMADS